MSGSILYEKDAEYIDFDKDTVVDLRIDQIVDRILDIRKEYSARDYFFQKPAKFSDIPFRLAVVKDLENGQAYEAVERFLGRYGHFRLCLDYSFRLPQARTRQKWLLDAACEYCDSVSELYDSLSKAALKSEGLRRFHLSLRDHMNGDSYRALACDAAACRENIESIRYSVDIDLKCNTVGISKDCGGEDYFDNLASVFEAFGCDAFEKQIIALPGINMGPLELSMLESLAGLYPGVFESLEAFYDKYSSFDYGFTDRFVAEALFYLSYIDYMAGLRQKGYVFSYPEFTESLELCIKGGYDLSLIDQPGDQGAVSANDFISDGSKRCFVITGPSQSGKTAYARMIGQAIYFLLLGLPAPCCGLEAFAVDNIYTHFARQEDLSNNYGRLKEELVRAKQIFDRDSGNSIIIFDEILGSTTSYDANQIGIKLFEKIAGRSGICIFATHIAELAEAGEYASGIYMAVREEDSGRVYTASRGKSAASAYTNLLLDKYNLYGKDIKERIS